MDKPNKSESRIRYTFRMLRPLSWWVLLVLVLYGIRTHQRLMKDTKLNFSVSLQGKAADLDAMISFDGVPATSGQNISLGRHTFTISHPKADYFSTNLFTFYGGHQFGRIDLKRSKGTLSIESSPRAARIVVSGPEYSTILTNSSGTNLLVPTDRYDISARYTFSEEQQSTYVSSDSTATVKIAPSFGAAQITGSHSNMTFRLIGKKNEAQLNGELPAKVGELPPGEYEIIAEHLGDRQAKTVWVNKGKTNDVVFEFKYGAARIETEPSDAIVFDSGGRERGRTPVTLPELVAGNWKFTLERTGYESIAANFEVIANETNTFITNLVSRSFVGALRMAQDYFRNERYAEAAQSAGEALKERPDDPTAKILERKATGFNYLARGRMNGGNGDFAAAISDLNAALASIPDNIEAKRWLDDYTARQQTIDQENARQLAEKRAVEERRTRIGQVKKSLLDGTASYVNSELFAQFEIYCTNDVKRVGDAIHAAIRDETPNFHIERYDWPRPDAFVVEGNQKVYDGTRTCVITGGQISTNEILLCFKVLEYQKSHETSRQSTFLGGLVTLSTSASITTQADSDGTRAARFQSQIQEGVRMVRDRIQNAIKTAKRN